MRRGHVSRRMRAAAAVCSVIAACSSLSAIATASASPNSSGHGESRATGSRDRDWPFYGHDLSNTRFNARERKINRTTVAGLTKSWSIDGLVGVTGTPTVSRRVAYFGDWTGTVRSVRAETGEQVWSTGIGGLFVVGAPVIKGDAVYVSSGTTLYRLDRKTGAVEWSTSTNEHRAAQINASPVVVDGLVLQGVAGIEAAIPTPNPSFRGSIGAYDAETGREVWRFYTTPFDDTSGAGIGIWSTPAIDRKLGLLFVGSGQNTSGPTGPLADSLLAIEYKTGKLRWSRQFTYPDVFPGPGPDADVGASPNLWASNGEPLVGAADKAGVYHALNRVTGELVWETRLTQGGPFGGAIGSAAFVDGTLIAVSNNAPNSASKAARARSRIRCRPLDVGFRGKHLRAGKRSTGRGLRWHDQRRARRARYAYGRKAVDIRRARQNRRRPVHCQRQRAVGIRLRLLRRAESGRRHQLHGRRQRAKGMMS